MSEGDLGEFEPRGIQRPPRGLPGAALAKEALKVAIRRSSAAWVDAAFKHIAAPVLTDAGEERVRERLASAVALGWVIMGGELGETRRAWKAHVELCDGNADAAGALCMAVYAKAGFVPTTELAGFVRLWAAAVQTSRLIPAFMER